MADLKKCHICGGISEDCDCMRPCERCGKILPHDIKECQPKHNPMEEALFRVFAATESMLNGEENAVECLQDIQRMIIHGLTNEKSSFRWSHFRSKTLEKILNCKPCEHVYVDGLCSKCGDGA